MKLRKIYEDETGEKALYRKGASDYHTLKYVTWLENKVEEKTPAISDTREMGDVAEYVLEDDDSNTYRCSNCDLEWQLTTGNPVVNEMNYCPKCGLKIKY
jgi:DNA-directed RNA polymerase subunit RPC12/RpoP